MKIIFETELIDVLTIIIANIAMIFVIFGIEIIGRIYPDLPLY